MLVSTHDILMVVELFQRTIMVDEGRIAKDHETRSILSDRELLEAHGLEAATPR